ncbi:MAG: hypothetical protein EOP84_05380 [Verrucomicrobiaceae bacterium]|nr:MAG: hypothetical protein EOP84_05380 [Verrucomicrobiaceae bacterium]
MSPRRARGQGRSRLLRVGLFVAAGLVVALIAAVLIGKSWMESYLRGGEFRAFVSDKAGDTLRAETQIAPLNISGQSFYTDGFTARGTSDAWFSELQLDQIRAELSTRRFWERVWQVEQVSVQRARITIDGERVPERVKSGSASAPKAPSLFATWIPNRVEVGSATIRETEIQWKGGAASGTHLQIKQQDEGWNIQGEGGRVVHGALPPLEVGTLKLRYREPALFVQDAELRQVTGGGTVRVNGEVQFGDKVDLTAKLDGVTMTPYLAGDWRARVHGKVSGEVRVQSSLPAQGSPILSGTLAVSEGQLEALPVLEEIATFTRTAQFRRLQITRAGGDFRQEAERLSVQNFAAESEGLIRVEGSFTIVNGQIDGSFQVGVTPASLQWLPGSQARVFTVSRGGYLWTPLRLTGPVEKPQEDLSPRLVAAAKGAIIEGAEGAVRDAAQTARDAVKGAIDSLFGR